MPSLTLQQALDLAMKHQQAGRLVEAESLYRQILSHQPDHAAALHMLGMLAHQKGRDSEAVELLKRAIQLNPNAGDTRSNLGTVLAAQGQIDQAIDAFRAALSLRPDLPETHNNLGNVLKEKGRLAEAISSYRQALALRPDYAGARYNLAGALLDAGQVDEAIAELSRALALRPDHAEAHNNLGNALSRKDLTDEAIAAYRKAVELRPDFAEGWNNLAGMLQNTGRHQEAIVCYRRSLRFKPDARVASNLAMAVHLYPDDDPARIYEEQSRWHETYGEPLYPQENPRRLDPGRQRLRIGYVSPDLGEHPVGRFLLPLLENHDHAAFEIFCYSDTPPDGLTERLRRHADVWRDARSLSHQQLADVIRADGIDILVDLAMHTRNNRLPVFARKPAPVQVTYLAYCSTTGLRTIDYRLTDSHLDPPDGDDRYYSERSIRLSGTYYCYSSPTEAADVSPLPASSAGRVTFGSLNKYSKITPAMLELWCRLLGQIPDSRLLVHSPPGSHRDRDLERAGEAGIDPGRIEFVARSSYSDYFKRYGQIDIALDPFPYAGATTTCDALWMGVPVVSLAGRTAQSRAGLSILSNVDLAECVARSTEEYLQIAQDLSRDLPRLASLRSTLRDRMRASPLMDAVRYAHDVEDAYRRMWAGVGLNSPSSGTPGEGRGGGSPREHPPRESTSPEAQFILGKALQQAGRKQEALAAYARAIEQRPDYANAYTESGIILQETGAFTEAAQAFRQALTQRPDKSEAHYNLAGALKDSGQLAEAISEYQHAIALKPDFAEALNNLGTAYQDQGLNEAAIEAFRQAITLRPDFIEALYNLGNASRDAGLLDEAIDAYRRVLALNPRHAFASNNLANALKDAGRLDDAIACYRRAVELHPEAWIHSNLLYTLHFHPSYNPRRLYEEHIRWNQAYARPLASQIRPHRNDRKPDRRLRVGYVSAHFTHHPVGRFLLPLLEHHDHEAFQIFCYSDVRRPTPATARHRACADVWREAGGLADEQLAQAIRDDQIDILVDLAMHMEGSRLLVFARKPAPVQITYLAYCGTTGLETMDYRLTDRWLDPPGSDESCYSERSLRLSRTYWCYQPPEPCPDPGPLPALAAGYITFGCLNNYCKVTDLTWSAWADLLGRAPGSRLIVHALHGSHRRRASDFLAARGIDPDRLEFVGLLPLDAYFRQHQRIDIALDPFPYPGGTTTCDALWMGVPVVTLAGQTAVSRAGLSILSNVGLPELVAGTTDEYVRIASHLAIDLPRLSNSRSTLRDRMRSSPLMNPTAFSRDIEAAYRSSTARGNS